jgi:hypothetical protein
MSDPRVIRGNTHSLARKISKARSDDIKEKKVVKVLEQRANQDEEPANTPFYSFVTKPFAEEDVDIMKYLVEREDVVVPTKDCPTQVDEFKPLPAPSQYIPRKTGVDKFTQVEDQSELFVFDREVAPMLDVIVRKTLEQAIVEVEQEFELNMLQKEVARYEEIMSNESNWMKDQENAIKRKQEEIRQQLNNILATKAAERQIKLGVAGIQMINQLVPVMLESIHNENITNGVWYLPEEEDTRRNIIPQILSDMAQRIEGLKEAEEVVNGKQPPSCALKSEYLYFLQLIDLLRDVVVKFDAIEKSNVPKPQLKLVVHIVKTLEGADNADEMESKKERIKEVELEIPIKLDDTVKSLQKKLQVRLEL